MLQILLHIILFVLPVLSEPTTSNDLFRAIALKVPKKDPQVCCLKPLTPLEPVDDEILVSFEEWKKKQLSSVTQKEIPQEQDSGVVHSSPGSPNGEAIRDPTQHRNGYPASLSDESIPSRPSTFTPEAAQEIAPHFRIPITDRYNYANLDCSARVHDSHRSAKSSSSILSSKKDRYMLSPCNTPKEKQFVVLELCDDIRIDTVQLANFEFFSGVFKDFMVSVSKTSTAGDWMVAGTYRAKNVRGVQSFYLPTSVRDFYRFLRIDFLSHYGSEFYCPVSLLRVYGLTHLEEWKWDMWQAETHERSERSHQALPASVEVIVDVHIVDAPTSLLGSHSTTSASVIVEPSSSNVDQPGTSARPTTQSQPTQSPASDSSNRTASSSVTNTSAIATQTTAPDETQSSPLQDSPSNSSNLASSGSITSTSEIRLSTTEPASPTAKAPSQPKHTSDLTSLPSVIDVTSSASANVASHPPVLPVTAQAVPPAHPQPHGESIYRTIMNRLTAVENNQTLYMKYVEQQHAVLRDVIKRLGEDLGRLEGITRAQGLAIQRAFDDWDKQRYQQQMETRDILQRIENLSEEMILEKRLGVAQLCLLLAVLVFLGLTRGSRAPEPPLLMDRQQSLVGREKGQTSHGSNGFREWGRRHLSLSFSGDSWMKVGGPSESPGRLDLTGDAPSMTGNGIPEKRSTYHKLPPRPLDLTSLSRSDPDSNDENANGVAFPVIPVSSSKLSASALREHNRPLSPLNTNHPADAQPTRRARKSSNGRSIGSAHRQRKRTNSNPHSVPANGSASGTTTPTALVFGHDSHYAASTALRTAPLPGHHVMPQHTRRATHYIRPVTPTKGHFVFAASRANHGLQRSHSHGGARAEMPASAAIHSNSTLAKGAGVPLSSIPPSISWGVVPKSAKKWARSAHLHEVKNVRVGRGEVSVNGYDPKEVEKGKEREEDVFSRSFSSIPRPSKGLPDDEDPSRASSVDGSLLLSHSDPPGTVSDDRYNDQTSRSSLSLLHPSPFGSSDDGDFWVDTDND